MNHPPGKEAPAVAESLPAPAHSTKAPKGPSAPLSDPAPQGFNLLWAASILVPLLVFAAAAYWSWRSVETETRERLERTVDMLHEHALRSFETQEAILEAVDQRIRALTIEEVGSTQEVHTFMAGLVERTVPSGGMVIVGPDNRIISGSVSFPVTRTIDLWTVIM